MTFNVRAWLSNNGLNYLVMALWLSVNAVLFWDTYGHYKRSTEFFYLHEMLGVGLCISRATATLINVNLGVLLLPMCRAITSAIRGSKCRVSLSFMRRLVDRCKGFHMLCATITVLASLGHFVAHSFNALNFSIHYDRRFLDVNAAVTPQQDPLAIVLGSVPGVTGLLLMVLLSIIVSSAMYSVRFGSYDVFWYTHRLYLLFYLLVFVHAIRGILKRQKNLAQHVPGCIYMNASAAHPEGEPFPWPEGEPFPWPEGEPVPELTLSEWNCDEEPVFDTIQCSSWMWIGGPLAIYLCDTMYRMIRRAERGVCVMDAKVHPADVLELQIFQKDFRCRPGQYVLLQCPVVSTFEWHPYTVTQILSSIPPGTFTVHIKTLGDWSGELVGDFISVWVRYDNVYRKKLKDKFSESLQDDATGSVAEKTTPYPRLNIDGPFGSPMVDVLRYRVSLCIAGGVGITPFSAVLHHIRDYPPPKLKRLYLIWICRNVQSLLCFADLLCNTYSHFWEQNRPDVFDIQIYLTAESPAVVQVALGGRYQLLRRRTFLGRPTWPAVFHRVAAAHSRGTVGAFCCGPKHLNQSVAEQCNSIKSHNTTFKFHHESF